MRFFEREIDTGAVWVRPLLGLPVAALAAVLGFALGSSGSDATPTAAQTVAPLPIVNTVTTVQTVTETRTRTLPSRIFTRAVTVTVHAPATPTAGRAARLSTAVVTAAVQGAATAERQCAARAGGDLAAARALAPAATQGVAALDGALAQDPDTAYPDGSGRTTMRALATALAAHAGDGGTCGANGRTVAAALAALHH